MAETRNNGASFNEPPENAHGGASPSSSSAATAGAVMDALGAAAVAATESDKS